MTELRLFLLGAPRLECRGEPVDLGLRKAMALLAYLAVTNGEYGRDELATLLWPESDQSSARASLRRTLYRINRTLGEGILTAGTETVRLHPEAGIWTDVAEFHEYVLECCPVGEPQEALSPHCMSVLEEAVALYSGDLLAGFTLPDCLSFDEWLFFEAEGLRELLARALTRLAPAYQARGDYQRAVQHARRWLMLDPLDESAHRLLMRLYAESGQQAAALRQYTECARILDEELGLSPDAETTELYQEIRLFRETAPPPSLKARPPVEYVSSGDVHIAYQVIGDGPVDILHICGYLSPLGFIWDLPDSAAFCDELASFSRLIVFDRRGSGLSDRSSPPTLEDTVDDILAVMQAAGSKHPVLFGTTEAGPNCALFAATHPGRVSGLILYGTQAKWVYSEDYPPALTREQWAVWLKRHMENWGGPLDIEYYAPSRARDPLFREWWARALRTASSPGAIKAVLEVMQDIDVRDILPAIRTPTLILHRKGTRNIRVGAGRHLAGQIPGAKYVELEGQDYFWFVGDSQAILREIRGFVHDLSSPVAPERMLATILLVEVIDGDDASRRGLAAPTQLDATYAFLRQEVARFRGSEVSWSQGRYTATFDGPSRAINCAKSIVESLSQRDTAVRAGLHTGECEFAAGELVGAAVQIAEGVLVAAASNEVLVSRTARDLVAGSGFQYAERRQCTIDGIARTWAVYPVK
jgi:DNA-binding SARP family transcriptional activator/pimeloyl-ACP methyl ester carboxylesterase/class 3 adenylate cyclase